jgi:tetrapyrrole methylase family protein/MazG family protein
MTHATGEKFSEFMTIVRRLRTECPWDREQTHSSIRHSLIEETYEVIEAIEASDAVHLRSELGDLLLHIALHAVMAEEEHAFTVDDIIDGISEKMIRRHPHVFGTTAVADAGDVKRNWERIKVSEGRTSVLDGVPTELPALLRAHRTQEKASKIGFDWARKEEVWKKVREEIEELTRAEESGDNAQVEEEFGDLLFALVNYSRFLQVNPEFALRGAVDKFARRFRKVEEELRAQGKDVMSSSLEEMDRLWNEGKHR